MGKSVSQAISGVVQRWDGGSFISAGSCRLIAGTSAPHRSFQLEQYPWHLHVAYAPLKHGGWHQQENQVETLVSYYNLVSEVAQCHFSHIAFSQNPIQIQEEETKPHFSVGEC